MWLTKLTLCAVIAVAVASVNLKEPLEKDEIIEAVNAAKTTWTARRNFHPDLKKDYVKRLLGLKRRPGKKLLPELVLDEKDYKDLPTTFDARSEWPKCKALQTIRDQGPCGSCWAVSAAATFTDRLCIHSNYSFNGYLSAEDVMTCCTSCGEGCDGGYLEKTWKYFLKTGIVTGGDYKSKKGCQPYQMPSCDHHVNGTKKNCDSYDLPTPSCETSCTNTKYKTDYASDKHKVKSAYSVSTVSKIQQELYANGPLQVGFNVYEDFLSYESGVYQHTTGSKEGGHAVTLIGWGVEDSTPYWLVQNNWNTEWGDEGLFKILKGKDECGIESEVYGGIPVV